MTRQCGTCTKCCDGWLSATIYDFEIGNEIGCPLRSKTGGCSIHSDPTKPHVCSEFRCAWLRNEKEFLPDWMRPDISNQIVLFHRFPEYEYFEVVNAGSALSVTMIAWFVGEAKRKNINLKYRIGDEVFLVGDKVFKTTEFLKQLMAG